MILSRTIQSTDYLASGFLVALVLGVFAGLNGIRTGFLGAAAAFVGLVVKGAMSVTWVYTCLGLVLVGVVLAVLASVLLKNSAITELVKGIQNVRTNPEIAKNVEITKDVSQEQSWPTQKLVQYTKLHLKLKGKI